MWVAARDMSRSPCEPIQWTEAFRSCFFLVYYEAQALAITVRDAAYRNLSRPFWVKSPVPRPVHHPLGADFLGGIFGQSVSPSSDTKDVAPQSCVPRVAACLSFDAQASATRVHGSGGMKRNARPFDHVRKLTCEDSPGQRGQRGHPEGNQP